MEPFFPDVNAKDSGNAPPERLLLHRLDEYFARNSPPGPGWLWRLSASALRRYLLEPEHPWSEQAARVLTSPNAAGMYLEKLQRLQRTFHPDAAISVETNSSGFPIPDQQSSFQQASTWSLREP